jgi:hypothetical protein
MRFLLPRRCHRTPQLLDTFLRPLQPIRERHDLFPQGRQSGLNRNARNINAMTPELREIRNQTMLFVFGL